MAKRYLIIGSGPAGVSAAESVRSLDAAAKITILSEEKCPYFYRPRLPEYVIGRATIEELQLKGVKFYREKGLTLELGQRAGHLDIEARRVVTEDGRDYAFDVLLIATGIVPNRPPWPGSNLSGVMTMHNLQSAEKLKEAMVGASRAVVIGGGLLGIDMAGALVRAGLEVTQLVREDYMGFPTFDSHAGRFVEKELQRQGVRILLSTEVREFAGEAGRLKQVITQDGQTPDCDLAFVAIGAKASVDWLEGSGLSIERGVRVDQYLSTNVANLFAAGSAAAVPLTLAGRVRLQTNWFNALNQGRTAGRNMARSHLVPYRDASSYFMHVGKLAFNILGTGCTEVEGCSRALFESEDQTEFIHLNHLAGTPVGCTMLGAQKYKRATAWLIAEQIRLPALCSIQKRSMEEFARIIVRPDT